MHDLNLHCPLDLVERVWLLRICPMSQPIYSKGMVTAPVGEPVPVIVIPKAQARPIRLVVGYAVDEDLQHVVVVDEVVHRRRAAVDGVDVVGAADGLGSVGLSDGAGEDAVDEVDNIGFVVGVGVRGVQGVLGCG